LARRIRMKRISEDKQGFNSYLNIFYVPGAGEVAVLCGAVVGASLGRNAHH